MRRLTLRSHGPLVACSLFFLAWALTLTRNVVVILGAYVLGLIAVSVCVAIDYTERPWFLSRCVFRRDEVMVVFACPLFLFEWYVNAWTMSIEQRIANGLRIEWRALNWWTRRDFDALTYSRVVVDSVTMTDPRGAA